MVMRRAAMVLALVLVGPSLAEAQPAVHRLRWDEGWARVHPGAYVAGTLTVAGAMLFDGLYEGRTDANVVGPILLDSYFRDALRAPIEEDRERAALVSDVLLGLLRVWPLFDSLVVVGLGDLNSDLSWQLSMISAEAYAVDLLFLTLSKLIVHRERPHGLECTPEERESRPGRCGVEGRTRSFYSGHASAAFNAAGVICITHAYLPIYAASASDAFACGAALAVASVIGVLRMIADRHFASDVVLGSVMGVLTGALLPWALHFQWDLGGEPDDEGMRVDPLRATHLPLLGGAFP